MRDDMPSSNELEETLLLLLSKSKKIMNNNEMLIAVSNYLFLSPKLFEIRRYDGRSELRYRMAWARTHAKEKGLIENKGKAIWGLVKNN
jgi:restriction system protein